MPGADDAAELRSLQERAYGREGSLSAEQSARLRELEGRRRTEGSPASIPAIVRADAVPAGGVEPTGLPDGAGDADAEAGFASDSGVDDAGLDDLGFTTDGSGRATVGSGFAPAPSARRSDPDTLVLTEGVLPAEEGDAASAQPLPPDLLRTPRRHLRSAAALALAAVAGLGLGWVLFADHGPSLSAELAQQRDALEQDGDYLPGSVEFVAEDEGAALWHARPIDQEDGLCAILTLPGADKASECSSAAQLDQNGGFAAYSGPVDDPAKPGESVYATLVALTGGGYGGLIERVDNSAFGIALSQAQAEERTTIAEAVGIEEEGVTVVGTNGSQTVWLADTAADERCLLALVAEEVQNSCVPIVETPAIELPIIDGDTATVYRYTGPTPGTDYTYRFDVENDVDVSTLAPFEIEVNDAQSITVDEKTGQVIDDDPAPSPDE